MFKETKKLKKKPVLQRNLKFQVGRLNCFQNTFFYEIDFFEEKKLRRNSLERQIIQVHRCFMLCYLFQEYFIVYSTTAEVMCPL